MDELEKMEKIMLLMTKHRITAVEFDGLKMVKEIHEPTDTQEPQDSKESDEEVMFLSAD